MPKDNALKRFGKNIRDRREALGLSQEALAEKADLDRTYIGGVERGERNATLHLCRANLLLAPRRPPGLIARATLMPAVPADLPAIWKFGKSITQLNGNHVPPPMHPSVTLETITAFLETLGTETIKCSPGGEWVFADGESVFRCKTSARRIADAFDGCVVGFFSADNPTAEIASGEDGHDFAIIADRFIVDYWGACATGMLDRPVFDLSDPADHHIISRLYGSKNAWRTVDGKSVRTNP